MELRFNQSDFSAGQFDPRAFARDDYIKYYKAAKIINNAVVVPQGGVQRRWGTEYVDTLVTTNPLNVDMSTLVYDDDAVYLLVFEATSIKIYLEDTLVAQVSTSYAGEDIQDLRFCQVQNRIVVVNGNNAPMQLFRTPNSPTTITAINTPVTNTFTFTAALIANTIYPVQFATTGALPTTSPQIFAGRTYFIKTLTTTTAQIYSTSDDAYFGTTPYTITALGNNSTLIVQNTWTFQAINFINIPTYDFSQGQSYVNDSFSVINAGYPSLGPYWLQCTTSSPFDASYINGIFTAGSGTARLLSLNGAGPTYNTMTIDIIDSFGPLTISFPGDEVYIAKTAWSDVLGWPRTVTFWQNRLVFGGTASINNGVWLSETASFFNFNDVDNTNDSDAIDYYPSNGGSSYIRSLTSAKSLLVHTTTGTYTSSTTSEAPATPSNFSLIEQNKDGVSNIQPVFIDNQVIYVDRSGNNAKNMIFDIIQGAYVLNNISVVNSICINKPVDTAALTEPNFTDGAYVLFVNGDGTLGIFQTLIEQNIAAWTKASTQNSDGTPAPYAHVASALNDAWFIVERTINGSPVLYIEHLDFTTNTDCTSFFYNLNSDIVTGLSYLEGQTVYAVADGFLVPPQVVAGGQITLPSVSQTVQVGLNFTTTLTLLPIGSIQGTPANLYKPMHVRVLYINYYNTVGGTIGGAQIQTVPLNQVYLDQPVVPASGVKELKLMGGWNLMEYDITITQDQPLPMTILGVGYVLEIP